MNFDLLLLLFLVKLKSGRPLPDPPDDLACWPLGESAAVVPEFVGLRWPSDFFLPIFRARNAMTRYGDEQRLRREETRSPRSKI